MSKLKHLFACLAANVLALAAAMPAAWAQADTYPAKAVRIVVPFPPGGGIDLTARIVAEALSRKLGQSFVVENRAGAAGKIGTRYVAQAAPDGYTLLVAGSGSTSFAEFLDADLGYDPLRDLAPVSMLVTMPYILVVSGQSPVRSVMDMVAQVRKDPGAFNLASSNVGTQQHLTGILFNMRAGTQMTSVPYKGTSPALMDVIGGVVQAYFSDPSVVGMLKDGKLRAVAVTGATRYAALPDVPTVKESSDIDFEATTWYPMMAPAGTPQAVIDTLNRAVTAVLSEPDVIKRLEDAGFTPAPSTPQALGEFVRSEHQRWGQVIQAAGLSVKK